ncbi:tRNA-intron lyase [Candidatus Bathyarchaeota archaeon]|nr:tRNA-intron lyase [Candidatus Bathyarchaeota archaeon]
MPINEIDVQLLPDNRLIVWDVNQANKLFRNGFYGRPLGVSKPKENFNDPLILDPVEGLYLAEKSFIRVTKNGELIDPNQLRQKFSRSYHQFNEKYRVYQDLRNRGFIIAPGIKYGCDFAVYEQGPGIDHAPYIVQIQKQDQKISAADIVKAGRLATTVRKSFILAIVNENIKYVEFDWWRA